MSYSIQQLKEKSIPLPITQVAVMVAEIFAKEQPTLSKKRRVYLNTLAVCVADNYMQLMGIPTELKRSDSWNPVVRLCFDVADLKLAELGHLECRPIRHVSSLRPDIALCHIPEDMPEGRIGCMIVEIDEVRRKANLLGFAKTMESDEVISTAHLSHMDEFEEYLEDLGNQTVSSSS